MEDKSLKVGTDNLPFPQHLDNDTNEYDNVRGENGATYSHIKGTSIVLPTEIRNVGKEYSFGSSTPLGANGTYISEPIDCGLITRLSGHVSADKEGRLYIQQSEDGVTNWINVFEMTVPASTTKTIGSVSYKTGLTYNFTVTSRYARVILVNSTTAQTNLVLSGYVSSL
jgi:hypothetical protein